MISRGWLVAQTIIASIWAIASVVAMTYGTLFNWPDFVHTDFGVPLTFATHTSDTIAGPVDKWDVNIGALTADLLFWTIGMVLVTLVASALFQSLARRRLEQRQMGK